MKNNNVKRIIFSSSATVYGNPASLPIKEDFPLSATNPYGRTKLMIEEILRDLWNSDNEWSIVLLRYFNPVGAHKSGLLCEDPKGIPNNLMPRLLDVAFGKTAHITVFGDDYNTKDGTGVRDYIHVVDLAYGHVKAVDYALNNKCVEAINLGTGIGYSVFDLIHTLEDVNNITVPFEICPRRPGDIDACYADPSKAKNLLGWEAELTLKDMCKDAYIASKNARE
jgi:UDP-glucose 4-epimerase